MITLPDFTCSFVQLKDTQYIEQNITLIQYIQNTKKGLILYFYPKDNTQGCTLQATDFSQDVALFDALGYSIIGVSRDSIKTHKNFISKHNLRIGLISDTEEKLCKHFEVIQEKSLYGKKFMGIVRSSFVFNSHGVLMYQMRNTKAKEHSQKLYQALSSLHCA